MQGTKEMLAGTWAVALCAALTEELHPDARKVSARAFTEGKTMPRWTRENARLFRPAPVTQSALDRATAGHLAKHGEDPDEDESETFGQRLRPRTGSTGANGIRGKGTP